MVGLIVWSLKQSSLCMNHMNQRIFNRPRRKRVFFFFQWEKKNKKRQKPQMTFFVLLLSIVLVMVARVDSVWKFHSLRVAPLRDCINGRIGDRPRFTIFASAAAGASTSGQVLMNNGTNVAMVDFFEPLAIEFVLSDTEGTSKIEKSMSATVQMWGNDHEYSNPFPTHQQDGWCKQLVDWADVQWSDAAFHAKGGRCSRRVEQQNRSGQHDVQYHAQGRGYSGTAAKQTPGERQRAICNYGPGRAPAAISRLGRDLAKATTTSRHVSSFPRLCCGAPAKELRNGKPTCCSVPPRN